MAGRFSKALSFTIGMVMLVLDCHQFGAHAGLLDLGADHILLRHQAAGVACPADFFQAPGQIEQFARQFLSLGQHVILRIEGLDARRQFFPALRGAAAGLIGFGFGHFALEVAFAPEWHGLDQGVFGAACPVWEAGWARRPSLGS